MEKLGEIVKPIIRVRVKTWDEMVEQYGWYCEGTINLEQFGWHKELEKLIPDDRIIEVIEKYKPKEYYMIDYLYGISPDAIEEYLTDESGNDLTNPLHPANSELLPELKSEQEFKLKPLAEILEEECCQKVDEVSLDNPEHPANQELLPELEEFKLIDKLIKQDQAKAKAELLKFCDKATLTNNNLAIFKQIQNKSHLCHYTKFQLDYNINASIRFIHAFDDRPELVGKFIYKHHEEKLFSVIEPQLAEHFIKTQCSNEAEEFINRYVGQGKGKKYRRIKVTKDSLFRYFES